MGDQQDKQKGFNYDYIVVIFLYAWGFVYLVASRNIESAGARMFPYIVVIFSAFLSTLLLIKNIFHIGKEEPYDFSGTGKAVALIGMMLIYAFAVTWVGFYISTPIFLYVAMFVLGQRNRKVMVLSAILMPLFAYLLFDLTLNLRIPTGELF